MDGPSMESVSISTSLPFDNKCICAFHSQSIFTFDTKLWFCLINKNLSKTTHLFEWLPKKRLGAKNAQNHRFWYVNRTGTFYYFWWSPYLYNGKINYERFSRQTEKTFFSLKIVRGIMHAIVYYLWWKNTTLTLLVRHFEVTNSGVGAKESCSDLLRNRSVCAPRNLNIRKPIWNRKFKFKINILNSKHQMWWVSKKLRQS